MSRPREFDPEAVLDAALQAFWSGGLATTSVDDLLRATGLSRSSMYQCIGSRDALMGLAVTRYVEQQIAALGRVFAAQPFSQAIETLLTDAALDNFNGRGCLLANGLTELHGADRTRIPVVQAGVHRLAEALREAIARSAPQGTDSAQCCVDVLAAIVGLRTLQRAGIDEPMLQSAARRFARVLTAGGQWP